MSNVDEAKRILRTNSRILFGIFGTVESSGYFPPLNFLNEFFLEGSDPCDQDGRMFKWKPFKLTPDEYVATKDWWIDSHPDAIEDSLGETCWSDWVQRIIGNYDK
jgi:hypothetical protein